MTPNGVKAPLLRASRSLNGQACAQLSDSDLLERFIDQRDDAAFEALLHRHGPMVLGVCRRMLGNEADAEDAFQATFLVLVRKAGSIRPRRMVGNWLYGVAHNTALKAKAMGNKRSVKEQEAAARPKSVEDGYTWDQLQPVLDQELRALPDKYRCAIVLCDLEGKSLREVALHLGCPVATVGTRVARGRMMLARRLARKGAAPSVAGLAFLMTQNASAAVPPGLAEATTKAATAVMSSSGGTGTAVSAKVSTLTVATIKALLWSRLRVNVLLGFIIAATALAGVAIAQQSPLRWGAKPYVLKTDRERLERTWILVSAQQAGRDVPVSTLKACEEWTFAADNVAITPAAELSGVYQMESVGDLRTIDMNLGATKLPSGMLPVRGPGIFKFDGRALIISLADSSRGQAVRPTDFVSRGGDNWTSVLVLERRPGDGCKTPSRAPKQGSRSEGR